MAAQATLDAVQKLYIAYLGRAADESGLNFWADAIESGISTIETVATGFTLTPEYKSIYGNVSKSELVEQIYLNTFGRASDPEGKAFWLGQLVEGSVTVDTIALKMINIMGDVDKALVDQKVVASNAYTQAAGQNYDVEAGKNVLTNIGGGSQTPAPTPTINVVNSTAFADLPVFGVGADKFVTEFGEVAVAQVDTIILDGTYEVGDILTITGVAAADVVVTIVDGNNVANEINDAVNAAPGKTVTAALNGTGITLTANTAGTPFNATVLAVNKAAEEAVAQVDTITLDGTYEAGDILTITGVAAADVVVTIVDGNNVANEINDAVNAATGKTVTATISGSNVTLTADTAGTEFTATVSAANKDAGSDDTQSASRTTTTDNKIAVAAGTDTTQAASSTTTTDNKIAVAAGTDTSQAASGTTTTDNKIAVAAGTDTTQTALSTTTTDNKIAVAAGTDTTQAASGTTMTINKAAVESLSTVANLDVLANFAVGTDKVHLTNLGVDLPIPTALTRVADITISDLANDLAYAFKDIGFGEAALVKAGADVYLFANDNNAAFSATQDVVIKLTGVILADQTAATTVVAAGDYFV